MPQYARSIRGQPYQHWHLPEANQFLRSIACGYEMIWKALQIEAATIILSTSSQESVLSGSKGLGKGAIEFEVLPRTPISAIAQMLPSAQSCEFLEHGQTHIFYQSAHPLLEMSRRQDLISVLQMRVIEVMMSYTIVQYRTISYTGLSA